MDDTGLKRSCLDDRTADDQIKKQRFDNTQSTANSSQDTVKYDLSQPLSPLDTGPLSPLDIGTRNDSTRVNKSISYDSVVNDAICANGGKGDASTDMRRIESIENDSKLIASLFCDMDEDVVYDKLLTIRNKRNRVDDVTIDIIENKAANQPSTSSHSDGPQNIDSNIGCSNRVQSSGVDNGVDNGDGEEIFMEIEHIKRLVPGCDPNEVYSLLEKESNKETRVKNVIDILKRRGLSVSADSAPKLTPKKSDSISSDPRCIQDPVYRDMRRILKMFPDKDPNEIYALLEAHHAEGNRIQAVIDDLVPQPTAADSHNDGSDVTDSSLRPTTPKGKSPVKNNEFSPIKEQLKDMQEIFPDCDPNYLFNELENRANDAEGMKKLTQEMFENKNYPKLKDIIAKQEKESARRGILNLDFDFDNFMSRFPEALTYFYDVDRVCSENYIVHTSVYLRNSFPNFRTGYLKSVLNKHNNHLAPAFKECKDFEAKIAGRRNSKKLKSRRRTLADFPAEPDEQFYYEKLFVQHEQDIRDQMTHTEEDRNKQIEEARKNNDLFECSCCFDDECLFEDMMACGDGHLFCKQCIRRSSEGIIGQGQSKFPCLTADCDVGFPLSVLQSVLSAKNFSILLRRMQETEIQQAHISDLVSCPFCSFATIMPDENDKIFKCLNPECLKDSCRLCKEPNHIPLRCDEVEKQGETDMRTYIENKISEAMLRVCPRCNKRFVKEYGCNKMTCTCGETMCYVCREPGIDYNHFQNGTCPTDSNLVDLHKKEMEEAAKKAKEQYLKEHPDLAGVTLKYDPNAHLKDYQKTQKFNPFNPGYPYINYDDEEEGSDYYDEDDDYY